MPRRILRLALVAALMLSALAYFAPAWRETRVARQFNDMLVDMQPDAAIQAGYIQTMHEQRWSSEAFFNLFGYALPLGKTEAVVRAPIRVYYGVRPGAIHVLTFRKGQLRLAVDRVEVLSVDVDISRLEIRTETGWARLDSFSGREARLRARHAFEYSKRRAADKILSGLQVTAHLRATLGELAAAIPGVTDIRIERHDIPEKPLKP
ncbi:MAG: hypothetical protein Q9M29_10120 [Mariprofundaceae bacterium]|nr:hypothetical protein [Mariprofundaceae bacterium]